MACTSLYREIVKLSNKSVCLHFSQHTIVPHIGISKFRTKGFAYLLFVHALRGVLLHLADEGLVAVNDALVELDEGEVHALRPQLIDFEKHRLLHMNGEVLAGIDVVELLHLFHFADLKAEGKISG